MKGYNRRRLRVMLTVLAVALALPTAAVIRQAYDQLKWESWYQYRGQAETLANRIDLELSRRTAAAEVRSFTDYSFLNVSTNANVLNRSPLSSLPVPQDMPGVIGYFQVAPDGTFTTPLLPADGAWRESGLTPEEFAARSSLAAELRSVLTGNRLLRDGNTAGGRLQALPARDAASDAAPSPAYLESSNAPAAEPLANAQEVVVTATRLPATMEEEAQAAADAYTQRMFDRLSDLDTASPTSVPSGAGTTVENFGLEESRRGPGKLGDLRLDDALEKKNEGLARQEAAALATPKESDAGEPARARRVEQSTLPATETVVPEARADRESTAGAISTFESEIDPFQFSLLNSGHSVLYRNVWRDGSRYIQGLLIDQAAFSGAVIESAFRATSLAGMSDLIIGYHGDVLQVIRGGDYAAAPGSVGELDGSLLYRGSLSAPFDALELVFSINRLPPGPGAQVLVWTSLVIAAVFIGGFLALYRLGIGQIRLARQQQDFVSAVSHELKTPLTSIRMYGEMLKEGWADEEKQKQYHEFIHDESERLTRLISNVLQLARITRSEPQFDIRPASVASLVDQVRSKIANQVERAGYALEFEIGDSVMDLSVELDQDCFAQIVINLVDNAIKFSKNAASKRIVIGCRSNADKQVVFSVRDFGPGIARGQLKKIFRLFYRSESELTRETVGTGIGLAIVHQLVNAMGGTVDVVNRDPGAEFSVAFPVA